MPLLYFHLNGSIKIEIEAVCRPQLHTKANYCYSEDSFVYFTQRKYLYFFLWEIFMIHIIFDK